MVQDQTPIEDASSWQDYSTAEIMDMAEKLDEIAVSVGDPWDLLQHLGQQEHRTGMKSEFVLACTERALAYGLTEDIQYAGALTMGVSFSSPDRSWPSPTTEVPEVEKAVWNSVAEHCKDDLPRAHLLDLVLSARIITGLDPAIETMNLYWRLGARNSLKPYYKVQCLRRAWSLARKFNRHEESEIRKQLYDSAEEFVYENNVALETQLQPFEVLAVRPRRGEFFDPTPKAVRALLWVIFERVKGELPFVERIVTFLEKLAETDDDRREVRIALVENYLFVAEKTEGMAKVQWLETASSKAEQYGLKDLRDSATKDLQSITLDDLEMSKHTHEIVIPSYVHDSRLRHYRSLRDPRIALDYWLVTSSPTGSYEANKELAAQQSKNNILSFVTRTAFNSAGLPEKTSIGPEAFQGELLEQIELMNAGTYGTVLARELELLSTEFDKLSVEEIAIHLSSRYRCDYELSFVLGDAICSFWDKRYSDAGRVAYPLVEAGARGLLLTLNDPLYKVQLGNSPGRFPSLESYAERLENHGFDDDWLRCLRNPVAKLRNALAHGHRHFLREHESAVLVRMAALLVVLTPSSSRREDRAQVDLRLRNPIEWVAGQARLVRSLQEVWVTPQEHK